MLKIVEILSGKKTIFLFVFLAGPLLLSMVFCSQCKKGRVDMEPQIVPQAAVDSVNIVRMDREKGEIELEIHGMLPNPAYRIDRLEIRKKGRHITIIPIVSHNPKKIVIQVTVPFTEKCKITKVNTRGRLDIKVVGANKTILQSLVWEKD